MCVCVCVCVCFVCFLTKEFICRSTFIWESTEHVTMNKIFDAGAETLHYRLAVVSGWS